MNLQGKTIIITGASGGIGQALARQLAAQGARLIVQGRNEAALQSLLTSLEGDCAHHSSVTGDLNDDATRAALVNAASKQQGSLLALINNAGISDFKPVAATDDAALQQIFSTNVIAPIALTRDLLPLLLNQESGHARKCYVVNIGSTFGSIGYAGFTSYCSTKFALRGFSEALRRELHDTNVGVKYIAPRATKTQINPGTVDAMNEKLGNKIDDPKWVASQIVAALKNDKLKRKYLGWPEKFFVRLNQVFPALVDKALARTLPTIRYYLSNTTD